MSEAEPSSDGRTALECMLEARSVAVVGASVKEGSLGRQMLIELRRGGYDGAIFPVNPGYEEIDGLRCYPTVADAPGPVDLAMLGVANARLEDALRGAVEAGARSALTFASMYEEPVVRGAGAARAARRHRARRRHGVLRRQLHGLPQHRRRAPRDRLRDARRDPGGSGHVDLALGLGVRGVLVQRPRPRVRPAGLARPGDRDDDGRVHGVRAGAGDDPRDRAAAGDRARPRGLPPRRWPRRPRARSR